METIREERGSVRRAAAAWGALVALAALGSAQVAGSQSAFAIAQRAASNAGGTATSAGGTFAGTLESHLGLAPGGGTSSAAFVSLVDGVVGVAPAITTSAPLVFGVSPGFGSKTGVELVDVFGFNFTAAGAGANTAEFGDRQALAVQTLSNTRLAVTTPSGVSFGGNPKTPATVEVTNGNGTAGATDAFRYLPALLAPELAAIDASLELGVHHVPNTVALLVAGTSSPGLSLLVFPFEGSLELFVNPIVLGVVAAPTGQSTITFSVPDSPNLIGKKIELQALAVTDLVVPLGAFTNAVALTFVP